MQRLVGKPDYSGAKIVVAMVGLPARGKSYLSNKLTRYLKVRAVFPYIDYYHLTPSRQWLEYDVEVFNVGQLRRKKARDRRKKYVRPAPSAPHTKYARIGLT